MGGSGGTTGAAGRVAILSGQTTVGQRFEHLAAKSTAKEAARKPPRCQEWQPYVTARKLNRFLRSGSEEKAMLVERGSITFLLDEGSVFHNYRLLRG
jgi:hypothetical protein